MAKNNPKQIEKYFNSTRSQIKLIIDNIISQEYKIQSDVRIIRQNRNYSDGVLKNTDYAIPLFKEANEAGVQVVKFANNIARKISILNDDRYEVDSINGYLNVELKYDHIIKSIETYINEINTSIGNFYHNFNNRTDLIVIGTEYRNFEQICKFFSQNFNELNITNLNLKETLERDMNNSIDVLSLSHLNDNRDVLYFDPNTHAKYLYWNENSSIPLFSYDGVQYSGLLILNRIFFEEAISNKKLLIFADSNYHELLNYLLESKYSQYKNYLLFDPKNSEANINNLMASKINLLNLFSKSKDYLTSIELKKIKSSKNIRKKVLYCLDFMHEINEGIRQENIPLALSIIDEFNQEINFSN